MDSKSAAVTLADKIIVLSKGEIAEVGSHQQLMAKAGLYQSMFDI